MRDTNLGGRALSLAVAICLACVPRGGRLDANTVTTVTEAALG
jgi:hypothetical protein